MPAFSVGTAVQCHVRWASLRNIPVTPAAVQASPFLSIDDIVYSALRTSLFVARELDPFIGELLLSHRLIRQRMIDYDLAVRHAESRTFNSRRLPFPGNFRRVCLERRQVVDGRSEYLRYRRMARRGEDSGMISIVQCGRVEAKVDEPFANQIDCFDGDTERFLHIGI